MSMTSFNVTCFLVARGDEPGTGDGESMGLLAPEPEPAIVVLRDVVANDGCTPEELIAVATLTGGFTLEGGMREEGRLGGRVSPAWANVISFIA